MTGIVRMHSGPLRDWPLIMGLGILVAIFAIVICYIIIQIVKIRATVKKGKNKFTVCDLLVRKLKGLLREKSAFKINMHLIPNKEQLGIWAEFQKLQHRDEAVKWCFRLFTASFLCTLVIFLLVGFHFEGFSLPSELLNGLEFATVGQVAGLVMVAFKFLFRSNDRHD